MSRDATYEAEFLHQVEHVAELRFAVPAHGFADRVRARLAIGAERYGDNDFQAKNVIGELLEETPDVAAYALLEAQKMLSDEDRDDSLAHHLFEAAIHAAAADWHAMQCRKEKGAPERSLDPEAAEPAVARPAFTGPA